jgi:hypothetical protein
MRDLGDQKHLFGGPRLQGAKFGTDMQDFRRLPEPKRHDVDNTTRPRRSGRSRYPEAIAAVYPQGDRDRRCSPCALRKTKMAASKNDLDELVAIISIAIEKARQLNMQTSAYILSMALAEVSKAAKAAADKPEGGGKA